ncbi:MAG: hypothetical protein FJZ96_09570 [Chloroflexi bacterium]|nr:hypothetical protein [Chloroflexota bacterium]
MTTFEPSSNNSVKPGLVQAIAILTLINGIFNILWGAGVILGLTLGIVTLCLAPLGFLPLILGIFEIIYAAKLLANPPQPAQPSQTIAILEICCILVGNLISLIVGILALVFYGDPQVKAYFAGINGQPVAATIPVTPVQAETAPVVLPVEPIEAEKPKRRTRKSGS